MNNSQQILWRRTHVSATAVVALFGAAFTIVTPSSWRLLSDVVSAAQTSCTNLAVDADQVRICRDSYGVPHIFAETNKALFQGFGYADLQDRRWYGASRIAPHCSLRHDRSCRSLRALARTPMLPSQS